MKDSFFRTLDTDQEEDFRYWVHENKAKCLAASEEEQAVWHPVIRDEIEKLKRNT
jgi:hypothetical protein